MTTAEQHEAKRLEDLWAGEFGNAYTERNDKAANGRDVFWGSLLKEFPVESVLEIGCNRGANLQWIAKHVDPSHVYGVDVNASALKKLRELVPDVNAFRTAGKDLPFRDNWFELTFTAGVLIHQPEESVGSVMNEIYRCSKKYVLCMEYFAEQTTEVPYRGQEGALFKRNYGKMYKDMFPGLYLLKQGFLSANEGWDDVTWWFFEKE